MQNGHHAEDNNHAHAESLNTAEANGHTNGIVNGFSPSEHPNDAHNHHNGVDVLAADSPGPRGQKRKLIDTASGRGSRPPSPPWKKIQAEGPTTIIENGRRKSGRVNAIPSDTPPRTDKRPRRGAPKKHKGEARGARSIPAARSSTKASPAKSKVQPTPSKMDRTKANAKLASNSNLHASQSTLRNGTKTSTGRTIQNTAQTPTKPTRRSGRASLHSTEPPQAGTPKTNGTAQSPKLKGSKLAKGYVHYLPGPLPILNPGNVLRPQKYASLREYFENDDALEDDDDHRLTELEARREAARIQKVLDARNPGQLFADGSRLIIESEQQDEPVPKPAHPHIDHMVNHALELRRLMQIEQNNHIRQAKTIAYAVAAHVKSLQPETEEERLAKQLKERRQIYKSVQRELTKMFEMARASVTNEMLRRHQQKEEAKAKEELQKQIAKAEHLLQGRTGGRFALPGGETRGSSLLTDDHGSFSGDSEDYSGSGENSHASEDSDDVSEDDNDSDSDSNEDDDDVAANSDDDLTEAQLRAKYQTIESDATRLPASEEEFLDRTPSYRSTVTPNADGSLRQDTFDNSTSEQGELPELEEVDQALLDDSDLDSSSSGTEEDSDENSTDDGGDEGDSVDEEEDPVNNSLWGLFSKQEIEELEAAQKAQDDEQAADVDMEDADEPAAPSPRHDIIQQNSQSERPNEAIAWPEEQPNPTVEKDEDDVEEIAPEPRIPTPSLLRGTLRPYQQEGLDWLARMYANDTNGILADEMGLGKTIQSISLLAHLATYHEVWGPHLVVVPTSVLLNWEVEFKKFAPGFKVLSYYGTQEERKAKRKGWMNNEKWHVCITSYQLAVQDANSLRKRNWHYIILDEAHNIKNFRSQRWQTLLGFKSRARLLLTGTPLQNNLSELWSLLFFLSPESDEQGKTQFGELAEFAKQFHRPVEQILDKGQTELDVESRGIVSKLHTILRPHLLRRMKSEVEKQMPKKYEHITVCRLSKRQRQLYDEFMGRADTKESFASRNYMSIIACLMALRKVCNHPDLFETRSINTSYAMPKAAIADFEIKELLIRRRMIEHEDKNTSYGLLKLWRPNVAAHNATNTRRLVAVEKLADAAGRQRRRIDLNKSFDGRTISSAIAGIDNHKRLERNTQIAVQYSHTVVRSWHQPCIPLDILKRLMIPLKLSLSNAPPRAAKLTDAYLDSASAIEDMVVSLPDRSTQLQPYIQRFACVTPKVACEDLTRFTLGEKGMDIIQDARDIAPDDNFHEARMRLSIAFPDKTLIQYDCGKLQQLDKLLRKLQAGGHRALIFTQMTKVLDVLEQFLNLHGHRYMRLDGTTKIERRQILTDRFNSDPTFLCFILSTRSGGLGINLTGADTVIFYDNDWNPAMDKQCQDRCHRIGQTRDVHIYRFVCEGTIEMNILRKSNQKRELDKFIIQEGDFTTDFLSRMGEGDEEADDAIDQVLGGGAKDVLTKVEDKDDIDAAQIAEKEYVHTDDADFDEKQTGSGGTGTPQAESRSLPAGDTSTPAAPTPLQHVETASPAAAAETPAPQPEAQAGPPAVEDFEIEEDDGSKVKAPGLERNIRVLDGWLLEQMRRDLGGLRFETAEEQRRRIAKNKRRKGNVPLIRR